jgi:adenylylsulfate kinase-like enzyme
MKIIWLTGQSGSGKTAISLQFLKEYQDWFHIDGDDIRDLFNNKDYSEQGRRKNIELAQHLAQYLYSKGQNVIVSLIAPYRDQREYFKEKFGKDLIEIYLHTTEDRGKNTFQTNYETPIQNYIELDTTNKTVEESFEILKLKI